MDMSKIGYYGLGFNSCYNFTDLPSFVTSENLVVFDPQDKYTPKKGGLKVDFVKTNLASQFPHQIEPYKFFGFDGVTAFPGTIFRFPCVLHCIHTYQFRLRTSSVAKNSALKKQECTVDKIQSIVNDFWHHANSDIIFLRSIQKIEIWTKENDSNPQLQYAVNICGGRPQIACIYY
jgi:sacsin